MKPIDILGYGAGLLIVISMVPQIVKAWRTKLTRDLSLWRYLVYSLGLMLWVAYAILIKNGPVAFMNSAGLLLALTILFLKIRYK